MIELEYWDERGELVIANVPAGNPPIIPNGGDLADVAMAGNANEYTFVAVKRRHFYYLPDGTLTRVRLYCSEVR